MRTGRAVGVGRALLVGIVAALTGVATAGDDYDGALARYKAFVKRPSLFIRTRGRVRLAMTRDPRALAVLQADYRRPEEPKEQVRFLVATMCSQFLGDSPALRSEFASWRAKERSAMDAWLWYRTLRADVPLGGEDAVAATNDPTLDLHLRAAALRALADAGDARGVGLAATVLGKPPGQGAERALLPEAAASALRGAARTERDTPAFDAALDALIALLDEAWLPERSRLVVARHLAAVLATDVVGTTSAPWRRERDAAKARDGAAPPAPDDRYARPRFFDLEATGSRIAYVIDLSDSMLEPLTAGEKEMLGKDPSVPWDRIKSRFDAARAVLRASLQGLRPTQSFCVVLFGKAAAPLGATPGMMPATPEAVKAAVEELAAIRPGPAVADRPHGTLRGSTNLHGGIRRAFQARSKKLITENEHLDERAMVQGCDSVFVLSDGDPSWDDFAAPDTRDPDVHPGDPESGTMKTDTPTVTWYGPFVPWGNEHVFLVEDVRRMNLFRQAEIHCIGFGEANDDLLKEIADVGHGRYRRIGADAPKPSRR